jgi:hypothetical protein
MLTPHARESNELRPNRSAFHEQAPATAQRGFSVTAPAVAADPFGERAVDAHEARIHVLGARFRFQSANRQLLGLVDAAYRDLPRHRLSHGSPQIDIRLVLSAGDHGTRWAEPPRLQTSSGARLLAGTMDAANYAVLSPPARAGLIAMSRRLLGHPYHARYELIEFAVFTLASRVQRLVPLHAACVGRRGRAAVIVGDSGSGKSTLTLHCLLQGFDFVSEDSTFLCPRRLLATGVANYLHLQPDALRFVDAHQRRDLIHRSSMIRRRSGIAKLEVDVRAGPWQLARTPCRTTAVVFLTRRRRGKGPLLRLIGPREGRRRLERSQPYAAGQPGWTQFERRLATMPLWELRRGPHPGDGVPELRALLGG